MRKLESKKLVTYYTHHRAMVLDVFGGEIEDIAVARTLSESLIARGAAKNAKPEDIKNYANIWKRLRLKRATIQTKF